MRLTQTLDLEPKKILFFDVETNGRPKKEKESPLNIDNWPEVLSICYVLMWSTGEIIKNEKHILRRTDVFKWSPSARAIHGISKEISLKHGENPGIIYGHFLNALSDADFLVAHNMEFDKNVLVADILRIGEVNSLAIFNARTQFCTMDKLTFYWGKWPRLADLLQHMIEDAEPALLSTTEAKFHDPQFDVFACIYIFFEVMANPDKYFVIQNQLPNVPPSWQKPKINLTDFTISDFAK